MYRLNAVQQMADRLMAEVFTINGQQLSGHRLGYTFRFDNARRRLGQCNYTRKTITLSKHICLENVDKAEGKLKDTMLHELAHAFAYEVHGRGVHHDYRWVAIAKSIGCDGKRCYSGDDVKPIKNSKYTHTCPTCANTTPRHKMTRRSYSCTPCSGGRYNPLHKLVLTQNY